MKKIVIFSIAIIISLSANAFAHGSLITLNQTVGNYIVEFENNSFGDVYAQDFIQYDFRLLDKDRKDVPYDSVYTKFQNDNIGEQVSANLIPTEKPGPTYLGTAIAQEGDYNVEVDFFKGGKQLVQANFVLKVLPQFDPQTGLKKTDLQNRKARVEKYFWAITLVFGLGLGIFIASSDMTKKFFNKFRNK